MARGSIYSRRLKDGRTVYDVMYRTSDRRQRMKRGFAREGDAERWLNQQMAAVDRGEVIAVSGTFADYFDVWLAEHRPRIEDGTYRDYETHGRLRLKPYFGDKRLGEITGQDVRSYVAELSGSDN